MADVGRPGRRTGRPTIADLSGPAQPEAAKAEELAALPDDRHAGEIDRDDGSGVADPPFHHPAGPGLAPGEGLRHEAGRVVDEVAKLIPAPADEVRSSLAYDRRKTFGDTAEPPLRIRLPEEADRAAGARSLLRRRRAGGRRGRAAFGLRVRHPAIGRDGGGRVPRRGDRLDRTGDGDCQHPVARGQADLAKAAGDERRQRRSSRGGCARDEARRKERGRRRAPARAHSADAVRRSRPSSSASTSRRRPAPGEAHSSRSPSAPTTRSAPSGSTKRESAGSAARAASSDCRSWFGGGFKSAQLLGGGGRVNIWCRSFAPGAHRPQMRWGSATPC